MAEKSDNVSSRNCIVSLPVTGSLHEYMAVLSFTFTCRLRGKARSSPGRQGRAAR